MGVRGRRVAAWGLVIAGLVVVIPKFLPRNSASLAHGSEAGFVGWGGTVLYG